MQTAEAHRLRTGEGEEPATGHLAAAVAAAAAAAASGLARRAPEARVTLRASS